MHRAPRDSPSEGVIGHEIGSPLKGEAQAPLCKSSKSLQKKVSNLHLNLVMARRRNIMPPAPVTLVWAKLGLHDLRPCVSLVLFECNKLFLCLF